MTTDLHASAPPLVVDLDGTLIHSDLLWEAIVLFIKRHFLQIWRLPLWLLEGKTGFKARLAAAIDFDPAYLPYDQELLRLIARERESGRTIVLATGSERRYAERIAAHLKLFDKVLATDGALNLTSHNKADQLVALYGEQGFDYVGNAGVDVAVWRKSRYAFSVTAKPFALGGGRATEQMGSPRGGWALALLRAMRPRQWLKNLLVFVPMLAGHAITLPTFMQSLVAFVAFSLCASSAYLLNDALDAHDDRAHPTKQRRPIAAGHLPLAVAMFASPVLGGAALLLCALYDPLLLLAVSVYFASTLAYSLHLKRLAMVDIVTLALLYNMRIFGGAAATAIEPSFWLLAFSFFIFLSLAMLKRFSELFNMQARGVNKSSGRGYTVADKTPIGVMGVNSAFMAVLIFMLYFNSNNVLALYRQPAWLMGIVPLLVFWLGRLWLLASRGMVNEDPVLYVSRDRVSLVVVSLCVALAIAAAW
jgi:4-hydroxybenzoate polyprenyltransferase